MSYSTNDIPKIINDYKIGETLGIGSFGKVKLGIHLPTSEKVAIKILSKSFIKSSSYQSRLIKEINYLRSINHPNIVNVFEIIENEEYYFIILEYISGGELFNLISKKSRLTSNEACLFLYQIINSVDYLHSNKIVHRDLKPENILLSAYTNIIKLIDFGLATEITVNNELTTLCGSPNYSAPEMLRGMKYDGNLVDIWSIGIIAFVMICGYLPFEDSNEKLLIKKISNGKCDYPHYTPFIFRDFIKRTLAPNPKNRMSLIQMKEHTVYRHGRTMFLKENIIYLENNLLNPIIHEEAKRKSISFMFSNHIKQRFNDIEEDPTYKIVYSKILNTTPWKRFLFEYQDKCSNEIRGKKDNDITSPQDILKRLRAMNMTDRYIKSNERASSASTKRKRNKSEHDNNSILLNKTIESTTERTQKRMIQTPKPIQRIINLNLINHSSSNNNFDTVLSPTKKVQSRTNFILKQTIHRESNKNLYINIKVISPAKDKKINHKHNFTEHSPQIKKYHKQKTQPSPVRRILMAMVPAYKEVNLFPTDADNNGLMKRFKTIEKNDPMIISVSFTERTQTPLAYNDKGLIDYKRKLSTNTKRYQESTDNIKNKNNYIIPSIKPKNNHQNYGKTISEREKKHKKSNKIIKKVILSDRHKITIDNAYANSRESLLNTYFNLVDNGNKPKSEFKNGH